LALLRWKKLEVRFRLFPPQLSSQVGPSKKGKHIMTSTRSSSVSADHTPLSQKGKLSALPSQYIQILSQPSVKTFTEEKGRASWLSTWFQVILLGVISALLAALGQLISPVPMSSVAGIDPTSLKYISLISTIFIVLVGTPCAFFAASGVFYLFARILKGQGTFLEQTYLLVLLGFPMVILSSLLALIPTVGGWLQYVPHIYSL